MKRKIGNSIFLVMLLLAAFLFVKTVAEIKAYSFIGGGVPVSNTITVSGEGEVYAKADIANFSFSVVEEAKTVALAQEAATKKMNAALGLLREAGVEERDYKTTSYNIYPKYDYIRSVCNEFSCPPGRQELRGYEVSQSIDVKVRDTSKAGDLLADIGSAEVSNVSGLNFTIDDEDELQRDARKAAIVDAETKARELAQDLGVKLVRVVNFSENTAKPYYRAEMVAMDSAMGMGGATAPSPELPVGENTITSQVYITYEIR